MHRWLLPALLAGMLAASVRAAPPVGAASVEVLPRDADPGERPLEEEVRSIDAQVAEVRERIFRTKARLASLQELVTGEDAGAGARALVRHRNEMGAAFVLEALSYAIDGAPVFTETSATGELERKADLDVFAGRLAPGHHVLAVRLVYRATDGGETQRLKVEASTGFDVQPGKVTTVQGIGHERKAPKLDGRAAVRWKTDVETERAAPPGSRGAGR